MVSSFLYSYTHLLSLPHSRCCLYVQVFTFSCSVTFFNEMIHGPMAKERVSVLLFLGHLHEENMGVVTCFLLASTGFPQGPTARPPDQEQWCPVEEMPGAQRGLHCCTAIVLLMMQGVYVNIMVLCRTILENFSLQLDFQRKYVLFILSFLDSVFLCLVGG